MAAFFCYFSLRQRKVSGVDTPCLFLYTKYVINYVNIMENDKEWGMQKEKSEATIKIETIQGPNKNELSFSPQRGGIIKSMKLNDVEILYVDEKTFNDVNRNVRGGIPILFPNSGPLRSENNPYPELKQHGFARNSNWISEHTGEKKFSEKLLSNDNTKKVFPYDFEMHMKGELKQDGSVVLSQEVTNSDRDREMPVSMGLHPYFKVPNEKKEYIKFNLSGGEKIEQDFDNWSQGGTTSTDNPKVNKPEEILKIEIPELGTLIIDASVEYQKILIWSLPEHNFICIEPVMRNNDGLIDNPHIIKPNGTLSGKVIFRLER